MVGDGAENDLCWAGIGVLVGRESDTVVAVASAVAVGVMSALSSVAGISTCDSGARVGSLGGSDELQAVRAANMSADKSIIFFMIFSYWAVH